jgi:predicted DNA-binding transcriptional regulator AlpA
MHTIQLNVGITLSDDETARLARLIEELLKIVSSAPRKMTPQEASQHALLGGQKPPEDMGLLIDSRKAAKLLNVSERKLWEMWNSGQMPKPARIGRVVRWGYEELRAWVAAGCPRQEEWKRQHSGHPS